MNIKVIDLMVTPVITTVKHKSVGHAREIMEHNSIHALPIIDVDDTVLGIVTSYDLLTDVSSSSPVSSIMTKEIFSISPYEKIHVAARIMRNHFIHHLLVYDHKKLVGLLSTFDLLSLMDDHRYILRNPPSRIRYKKRKS